jgi:hypothetical protein
VGKNADDDDGVNDRVDKGVKALGGADANVVTGAWSCLDADGTSFGACVDADTVGHGVDTTPFANKGGIVTCCFGDARARERLGTKDCCWRFLPRIIGVSPYSRCLLDGQFAFFFQDAFNQTNQSNAQSPVVCDNPDLFRRCPIDRSIDRMRNGWNWTTVYYLVLILYYILTTLLFTIFVFYRQEEDTCRPLRCLVFDGYLESTSAGSAVQWQTMPADGNAGSATTTTTAEPSTWTDYRLTNVLKRWIRPRSNDLRPDSTNRRSLLQLFPGTFWIVVHSLMSNERQTYRLEHKPLASAGLPESEQVSREMDIETGRLYSVALREGEWVSLVPTGQDTGSPPSVLTSTEPFCRLECIPVSYR